MTALKFLAAASAVALAAALPACAESTGAETQESRAEAETGAMETSGGAAQDGAMADGAVQETGAAGIAEAVARIINREREEVGTAYFQQGPEGVVITIEADLGQGTGQWHGAHLHKIGDCSNEDFTSSGGHINVDDSAHGFLHPDGPDNADLPNLWVHEDGTLMAQAYTQNVSIDGQTSAPALLDEDGSAFVMHENRDDMRTQPIGGAGARILCGVIEPRGE
ncbi:MAG: superoxide dismutase family protein [Oceanicaulis sp.]